MFNFLRKYFIRVEETPMESLSVPRSPKWETVRNKFVKANPKCAVCDTDKNLNVHHIHPYHLHPELELDSNNLVTLCISHHLLFGHLMDWKAYNPTVQLDIAAWRNKIAKRPTE